MVIRSLFIPHWSSVFKNIGNKSLKRDIEVFFYSNHNLCSTKKQPLLTKRCSCVQQRHYASDRPTVREKAGDLVDSNQDVKKKPHFLKAFDEIQRDYLKIEEVVSVLRENMCEDLCVIKVDSSKTGFHYVDYFVVTSGRSIRHLKSMAFLLCSKFKQKVREMQGKSTAVVEGENGSDWLAVDIGNIVVHFMLPEARMKYELEKLWTLGPAFDDQLQKMLVTNDSDEHIVFPFKSRMLTGIDQTPL